jgi:hypothetical protein
VDATSRRTAELLAVTGDADMTLLFRLEPESVNALTTLSIAGIVRVDDSEVRFVHEAVRKVVLDATGRERRAALHVAVAAELGEGIPGASHLEAAARDLAGLTAFADRALAANASAMLARAAWRAWTAVDPYLAVELFGRAAGLTGNDELPDLLDASRAALAGSVIEAAAVRGGTDRAALDFPSALPLSYDAGHRGVADLLALAGAIRDDPSSPQSLVDVAVDLADRLSVAPA